MEIIRIEKKIHNISDFYFYLIFILFSSLSARWIRFKYSLLVPHKVDDDTYHYLGFKNVCISLQYKVSNYILKTLFFFFVEWSSYAQLQRN